MKGYEDGSKACLVSNGRNDGHSDSYGNGTFDDGEREGRLQGYSDSLNGRPSDGSCSSGQGTNFCYGYETTYNEEY